MPTDDTGGHGTQQQGAPPHRTDSRERHHSSREPRRHDSRERRAVDEDRGRGREGERYGRDRDDDRRVSGASRRDAGGLPPPPPLSGDGKNTSREGGRDRGRDIDRSTSRGRAHEKLSWTQAMTSDNPEAVRSDSAHRGSPAGGKHTEHASDRPPQYSGTPPAKSAGGNSLLAELRKAGQSLVGRQAHAQSSQGGGRHGGDSGAEDLEAGEIAVSDDGGGGRRGTDERKRRYSAGSDSDSGQLQGSARKAARGGASNGPGGGGGGLLSRAMDDVASFRAMQQRQQQDDLDAPVALKSSPSASGDSGPDNSLDAKYREAAARAAVTVDDDAQGGGAMSTPRDGDAGGGAHGGGVKSRWMVDDDGGQVPSDDQPERKGLGYGAGQPSTAAVPSGGGLGPDSDDSDEDDGGGGGNGNAPAPSPRTIANARYDMLQECRNVDEFEKINRISEGTYGVVYKAREKKTGRLVALKMIKMEKERDGFPITSIREINVMLNFHHKNIVHVSEICVGKRQAPSTA
ncbi:hypothetical protein FOA52_007692 [Chlamydomonas sp. UWO 241]|nr:hypothetical protein FOA52_007692 [Chlamydomonas sp. UWO 241]